MLRVRVIPSLLLKNEGLVKTVKFKNPTYVGDPINAVKIFNEKEVDELIFLDITATTENKPIPLKKISEIASECFMPVCYGGGIRTLSDIKTILALGIEKVSLNAAAIENPELITEAAAFAGSSSVVVSIDVRKNILGHYHVCTHGGTKNTKLDPVQHAMNMEKAGAGEILINSIDRDGTMEGFDIQLIKKITGAVSIPVIACGGAGSVSDLKQAVQEGGASGVSAGSLFVFHGKHRAVLISYPSSQEIEM